MPDETAISPQSAHDALQELHKTLTEAYRSAKSPELRDLLDKRLDSVEKLLTELNRADISSRTIALKAQADSMAEGLKRLGEIKARLQAVADNVGKVAHVLEDVDKVLSGVKQFFGIF